MNKIKKRACRYFLGLHSKCPLARLQGDVGWLLPKYRHVIALLRTWNRFGKLKPDRIIAKVVNAIIKLLMSGLNNFEIYIYMSHTRLCRATF